MSRAMLVNVVNEEESRIAIVSGGLLEELSIETSRHEQIEGNIYKARIVKIIPSLDAVFVDYGREKNGFLAVPDIHPRYFQDGNRGAAALKKGQELMVQVRKGEIGQKGAALTTFVSIPGRYFVIMPFVGKRGVSRKIQDDATRGQLRGILDDAGVPEDMGYIARTAAEGRTKQELTRDASYLVRLWKRIQDEFDSSKAPALLYQESDIVIRTLRDYFTPSIGEVWVDDKAIFEQVRAFFQAVMPWHQRRVKLYQQKAPLFSKYNLEAQIASIYEKSVPLKSGGSIVIEQTEALVSIDVNSGKTMKGKDIEETAYIANKEAAEEAARQLRLRDLGGLVVIDFIDMRSAGHRGEVKKVLQRVLKEDKARTDVGSISKFGILELSRQRLKPGAAATGNAPCPTCGGAGKVKSAESFALSVLRLAQSLLARTSGVQRVLVGVPPDAAAILANRKRRRILELEDDFQVFVDLFSEPALQPNQYYLECRQAGSTRVETNLPEEFPRALLRTPKGLPGATVRAQRPSVYALFDEDEETPEVPVEPPEEPETAKPEAAKPETAEAAANGAEPGAPGAEEVPAKKKRRRRKRRKKGEAGPEAAEQPLPAPQEEKEEEAEEPEGAEPEAAPETGDEPPRKLSASAKRRLRRKRKKEQEAALAAAATAGGEAVAAAPDASAAPESPVTPEPAEPGSAPHAVEPPPEASRSPASAAAAAPESPARPAAKRAPRKRTRRPASAAKPAPAPEAEPETTGETRKAAAPKAEKEPAEAPAKKPARPRRKRAAPEKPAAETKASAAPPAAGEKSPEPAPEAGKAKPKRRTRRPKKESPPKAEGSETP